MADEKPTIPTWGWSKTTGESQLFQLKEGEGLPSTHVDSPAKVKAESQEPKKTA